MTSESQLRARLRKIEALFVGAGTAGERLAAEAALRRVRAGSRNSLATIHRSNSNSHFPTNGPGTCFWRFVVAAGCGRFVITASDATR
jgi:hypothetical protein